MKRIICNSAALCACAFCTNIHGICCRCPGVEGRRGSPAAANPETDRAGTATSADRAADASRRGRRGQQGGCGASPGQPAAAERRGTEGRRGRTQDRRQQRRADRAGGLQTAKVGIGRPADDSLQGPQHHAGWLCGGRNCAALKSAWSRCFHPIQLAAPARRFAEQGVGVLRLRPPVAAYRIFLGPPEERGTLRLCVRRLSLGRRHLHLHPDRRLHVTAAPGMGTG